MTDSQILLLLAEVHDMIMGSTLAKCAVTDLAIQWAGWALAAAFRTEKFYDLAGNVKTCILDRKTLCWLVCSFACHSVSYN